MELLRSSFVRRFSSRFGSRFELENLVLIDLDPNKELLAEITVEGLQCWAYVRRGPLNHNGANTPQDSNEYYDIYLIFPLDKMPGGKDPTQTELDAMDVEIKKLQKNALKARIIEIGADKYAGKAIAVFGAEVIGKSGPYLDFATTYEYLTTKVDSDAREKEKTKQKIQKQSRLPFQNTEVGKEDNKPSVPRSTEDLLQDVVDTGVILPGGGTKRKTRTEIQQDQENANQQQQQQNANQQEQQAVSAFVNTKQTEFVALIVISETKRAHTFIYWSGDPHDSEVSVIPNVISYYKVSLPDQVVNDGSRLSAKLPATYNKLKQASQDSQQTTINPNNTANSVGFDSMSTTELKTLMFNLQPVKPPEDVNTYTQDQLRQGLPVDPQSLVGWYINLQQHSDIGYYSIPEESSKNVEPGGQVVKDFTFQNMAGHVRADSQAYLFSQKIHPPSDILTVFVTNGDQIPGEFQKDTDADALQAKFTLANFNSQVEFLVRYLRSYPDIANIKIVGHTDTKGGTNEDGKNKNQALSLRRANSFKLYLETFTGLGVPHLTEQESSKFIVEVRGDGQTQAEMNGGKPLGTDDYRFRKISIEYGAQ